MELISALSVAYIAPTHITRSIEIIDSFFQGAPHGANPVWFLGKSIQLLSQADLLVMGEGWEDARGCKLEYEIAAAYGIQIFTPYADITE